MARHKKDITPQELELFRQESARKRKISLARAKSKYQKSQKGKDCSLKYYANNQQLCIERSIERRKIKKPETDMDSI